MSYAAQLWLFFVLVFGAVIVPGMDMAFILGSALTGGRRNGFAAVGGAVAGAACHSVFAAVGIGLVLKALPWAFDALLFAGAAFIAWIGFGIVRSARSVRLAPEAIDAAANAGPGADAPTGAVRAAAAMHTFLRGTANNLLNPNAYLFSLAVFPQFIRPEHGALALQAVLLWSIIAATQIGVYGTVVLAAAQTQH